MSPKNTPYIFQEPPSSLTADNQLNPLDLNKLVVKNPTATFFVEVEGNSMEEAHIYSGDILVIDRSQNLFNNALILAFIDGSFAIRRLLKNKEGLFLVSQNATESPVTLNEEHRDDRLFGVITYIIHKAK